jgi:hypothetical protein
MRKGRQQNISKKKKEKDDDVCRKYIHNKKKYRKCRLQQAHLRNRRRTQKRGKGRFPFFFGTTLGVYNGIAGGGGGVTGGMDGVYSYEHGVNGGGGGSGPSTGDGGGDGGGPSTGGGGDSGGGGDGSTGGGGGGSTEYPYDPDEDEAYENAPWWPWGEDVSTFPDRFEPPPEKQPPKDDDDKPTPSSPHPLDPNASSDDLRNVKASILGELLALLALGAFDLFMKSLYDRMNDIISQASAAESAEVIRNQKFWMETLEVIPDQMRGIPIPEMYEGQLDTVSFDLYTKRPSVTASELEYLDEQVAHALDRLKQHPEAAENPDLVEDLFEAIKEDFMHDHPDVDFADIAESWSEALNSKLDVIKAHLDEVAEANRLIDQQTADAVETLSGMLEQESLIDRVISGNTSIFDMAREFFHNTFSPPAQNAIETFELQSPFNFYNDVFKTGIGNKYNYKNFVKEMNKYLKAENSPYTFEEQVNVLFDMSPSKEAFMSELKKLVETLLEKKPPKGSSPYKISKYWGELQKHLNSKLTNEEHFSAELYETSIVEDYQTIGGHDDLEDDQSVFQEEETTETSKLIENEEEYTELYTKNDRPAENKNIFGEGDPNDEFDLTGSEEDEEGGEEEEEEEEVDDEVEMDEFEEEEVKEDGDPLEGADTLCAQERAGGPSKCIPAEELAEDLKADREAWKESSLAAELEGLETVEAESILEMLADGFIAYAPSVLEFLGEQALFLLAFEAFKLGIEEYQKTKNKPEYLDPFGKWHYNPDYVKTQQNSAGATYYTVTGLPDIDPTHFDYGISSTKNPNYDPDYDPSKIDYTTAQYLDRTPYLTYDKGAHKEGTVWEGETEKIDPLLGHYAYQKTPTFNSDYAVVYFDVNGHHHHDPDSFSKDMAYMNSGAAYLKEIGKTDEEIEQFKKDYWNQYGSGTVINANPSDPNYDTFRQQDPLAVGEVNMDRDMSAIYFNDKNGSTWQVNYFDPHAKNDGTSRPPLEQIFEAIKNGDITPTKAPPHIKLPKNDYSDTPSKRPEPSSKSMNPRFSQSQPRKRRPPPKKKRPSLRK